MARIVQTISTVKTTGTASRTPSRSPSRTSSRSPGRTVDYAIQARKMRALLDLLRSGSTLSEAKLLKDMNKAGFSMHVRTLAREAERLTVLGFPVRRSLGEDGISYALEDNRLPAAVALLSEVRKELKKAGSPVEKEVAQALRLLRT